MRCDEARAALLDHLDAPDRAHPADLSAHLESCAECRALQDDVLTMQSRVRVWHELSAPSWNPDPGPWCATAGRFRWRSLVQQWLPLAASTATLVLAAGMYVQRLEPPARAPETAVAAGFTTSPATTAGPLAAADVLEVSRRERQHEMEALTALLKAELDRQAMETEQSLKYIIAHQIESQRELDAMRGRLLQTGRADSEQL